MAQNAWRRQLGQSIKRFRMERGLTMQKAADKYGCEVRWWAKFEQGRDLKMSLLHRIAAVLRVKPWQLLR